MTFGCHLASLCPLTPAVLQRSAFKTDPRLPGPAGFHRAGQQLGLPLGSGHHHCLISFHSQLGRIPQPCARRGWHGCQSPIPWHHRPSQGLPWLLVAKPHRIEPPSCWDTAQVESPFLSRGPIRCESGTLSLTIFLPSSSPVMRPGAGIDLHGRGGEVEPVGANAHYASCLVRSPRSLEPAAVPSSISKGLALC